ncbi:MAG: ABC transporter permease [Thermoguttaceae bacterium]
MYKLLLSWRYLRTRYIALASIISVTLGVATMIVVNSVMSGFTTEMQNRIHGILSDVVFESRSMNGFADSRLRMEEIRRVAGPYIQAMTPTVVVFAMLNFQVGEQTITRPIELIGIDADTQASVSDFSNYLQHPANREKLSFDLRLRGYDTSDHQADSDTQGRRNGRRREQMELAGSHRRVWYIENQRAMAEVERNRRLAQQGADPSAAGEPAPVDPFAGAMLPDANLQADQPENPYAPRTGLIMGIALASFPRPNGQTDHGVPQYEDCFMVLPGDDVKVMFPTAGMPPEVSSGVFTVVDFYESKMSEYDSSFVFVPIRTLQEMRGMIDPTTQQGMVNSIQIKLKPGVDGTMVRDLIQKHFPFEEFVVSTWQDKQSALLAAVHMETAILNVLLFLIIAVAGFGILAIFFMIVVEKTRDIGILKSLGASGWGVMGIFLSYGLALGLLGSGVGMVLGLLIVGNVNWIADKLGQLTGRPVFDPEIYYFYKIPAIVDPLTVAWVVLGAVGIAVLASVMPAIRAARLHPVEALRYE